MRIGVDIGGTFTDLVLSAEGHLRIDKLLSTPDDPARAMLAGLEAITPGGLSAVTQVAHGSTVATNAILERSGAKTALITTAGFRDLLFIGRQNRPQLYALHPTLPPPLIPREWCYEVPERLDPRGEVLLRLDLAALDTILDSIAVAGVEAVAVCFLFSYINPAHERAVRTRIVERGLLPEAHVALSCEVLPEFREYERASTTALEAFVRPVMSRYIGRLRENLPKTASLRIMKSDGGVISAETVQSQAVQTALSGPAAGVIGAAHLAALAGFPEVITLDMGGTSTDVALIPGEPQRRAETEIDGLPLRARLLDIETIGAGGGSIARLDAGGALRVGPQSAGADPGPAAYGRGGVQVTVSDANVVLGRLDAAHFLGGGMALDTAAAEAALAALGAQMGRSAVETAQGVVDVASASIERAVRRVSVARGYDPRRFTLVAFGGAGPLHACDVAARLDMPRVLVPRYPGVLCAFGLLVADIVRDYNRAVLQPASAGTFARLRVWSAEMLTQAHDDLLHEGVDEDHMRLRPLLDMRYSGQAYELTVPFKGRNIAERFHLAHEAAYGHALRDRPVEVVNLRLQAIGVVEKPPLTPEPETLNSGASAFLGDRTLPAGGGVALYDRERLEPGAQFGGAALIFQMDSTVFVPPDWSAHVDGYRNLVLTRQ